MKISFLIEVSGTEHPYQKRVVDLRLSKSFYNQASFIT